MWIYGGGNRKPIRILQAAAQAIDRLGPIRLNSRRITSGRR
jgi:hypothetical protein